MSHNFVWHAPKIIDSHVTIKPLLTPDPGVYHGEEMLRRIQAVQSSLYIQLQSGSAADDDFNTLIASVAEKIDTDLDVKIILSQYQKLGGWLERLKSAGINLANVKILNGVHNKGFIFDSKAVVIGSKNWSGDGVLRNRNASVVLENEEAVEYFKTIFEHDWNTHANQSAQ